MHRRRPGRGRPVRDLPIGELVIRLGQAADIAACIAIEIAAASRFAGVEMDDLIAITEGDPYMRGHGAAHAADGSLIVIDFNRMLVGYAALAVVDGFAHLCEIDVLPEQGGQGFGNLLMAEAEDWAKARSLPAMTLSTFIDVPWNGPWYARLGFRPYAPAEWPPGHQAIWQGQVESALDTIRRQMMIKPLA